NGANYHVIERGEPAAGVKSEEESVRPLADIEPIIEETASIEVEGDNVFEVRAEEREGAAPVSDLSSKALLEESELGRRRRRRRRRRERPYEDSVPHSATQPTDDGLAVVAEIGGDLVVSSGDADGSDQRGLRGGEERGRRSRGSRGGRNRFRRAE